MRIVATLCLVVLCGCGTGHDPERESTAAFDDSSCFRPLGSYCNDARPCPSYSASADAAQDLGSSRSCLQAFIGECGELRFTLVNDGFASSTRYFDSAGTLVAVRETTDVISQDATCPNWTHYGRRVTCAQVVTRNYCAR